MRRLDKIILQDVLPKVRVNLSGESASTESRTKRSAQIPYPQQAEVGVPVANENGKKTGAEAPAVREECRKTLTSPKIRTVQCTINGRPLMTCPRHVNKSKRMANPERKTPSVAVRFDLLTGG